MGVGYADLGVLYFGHHFRGIHLALRICDKSQVPCAIQGQITGDCQPLVHDMGAGERSQTALRLITTAVNNAAVADLRGPSAGTLDEHPQQTSCFFRQLADQSPRRYSVAL